MLTPAGKKTSTGVPDGAQTHINREGIIAEKRGRSGRGRDRGGRKKGTIGSKGDVRRRLDGATKTESDKDGGKSNPHPLFVPSARRISPPCCELDGMRHDNFVKKFKTSGGFFSDGAFDEACVRDVSCKGRGKDSAPPGGN